MFGKREDCCQMPVVMEISSKINLNMLLLKVGSACTITFLAYF